MAVCSLASIALNRFVTDDKTYNFEKLKEVTKVVTRNLNKIIDVNFYPVPEVRGREATSKCHVGSVGFCSVLRVSVPFYRREGLAQNGASR